MPFAFTLIFLNDSSKNNTKNFVVFQLLPLDHHPLCFSFNHPALIYLPHMENFDENLNVVVLASSIFIFIETKKFPHDLAECSGIIEKPINRLVIRGFCSVLNFFSGMMTRGSVELRSLRQIDAGMKD